MQIPKTMRTPIYSIDNVTSCIRFLIVYLFNLDEKHEIVSEPIKVDGFCIRTIEEDIKWEEYEKTNKNIKKPKKK
jgi:hypothetical protein